MVNTRGSLRKTLQQAGLVPTSYTAPQSSSMEMKMSLIFIVATLQADTEKTP